LILRLLPNTMPGSCSKESQKKIRQLEYVINQLQGRIGQIAASYETEIAFLKSNIEEINSEIRTLEDKLNDEEVD
jgi:predicted  nucleic acid-binding Zn-ribbon protein